MESTQIMELVAILGGTTIGGITIAEIVRIIVAGWKAIKTAKAIRYSLKDKEECVSMLKESQAKDLKVDISAELDKTTLKRVNAIEESQAQIVSALKDVSTILKATATCIGELKSISASSKSALQESLNGANAKVEDIQVAVQPSVSISDKEEQEQKVAY